MLDTKFHDLYVDHVSFVYDLMKFLNVDVTNFIKKLLCKRTLIIAKAIP